MKIVFIFGAGASREAGGPLMNDFLEKADAIFHQKLVSTEDLKAFEEVFKLISDLRTVFQKSNLNLDNIESLFGIIEMGKMLEKLGDRSPEGIEGVKKSIITLIVKTLELNIKFPIFDKAILPPEPYGEFVEGLVRINKEAQLNNRPEPQYSFITFNYDVALDYALLRHSLAFKYCLDKDEEAHIPLLKLHGSINWGICQDCSKITPILIDKHYNLPITTASQLSFSLFPIWSDNRNVKCYSCRKNLDDYPFVVPPTWNKTDYHQLIIPVWKRAAEELAEADKIIVVGYSLPETDAFFKYLFALGTDSPTRIKRFMVIDPSSKALENFQNLIGRGIENKFIQKQLPFKAATGNIASEVRKQS